MGKRISDQKRETGRRQGISPKSPQQSRFAACRLLDSAHAGIGQIGTVQEPIVTWNGHMSLDGRNGGTCPLCQDSCYLDRRLKQFTGIEKCQHRKKIAHRNHIGLSIRSFLRLEAHRLAKGISWFNARMSVIRNAVSRYLKKPHFKLAISTAYVLILIFLTERIFRVSELQWFCAC